MNKPRNSYPLVVVPLAALALTIAVGRADALRSLRLSGAALPATAGSASETVASSLPQGAADAAASTDQAAAPASGASASQAGSASADSTPLFEMPEGAEYEPQVVLIRVSQDLSNDDLAGLLGNVEGVHLKDNVTDGVVSLEVDEGISVEDAVNSLLVTGSFDDVQPNFIYTVMEEAGSGAAGLSSALAAYEEQATAEPKTGEPAVVAEEDAGDASQDEGDATDTPQEADDAAVATEAADGAGTVANEAEGAQGTEDAVVEDAANAQSLVKALEINDPLAPEQYSLEDVNAYQAWSLAKAEKDANGKAVTVGVVDVGFDAKHEDLVNNVVLGYNVIDKNTDVANTVDRSKHGTHVAGVISAQANNKTGVAGVSYNAQLALVRVADSAGKASSANIVSAYDYLLARKDELNLRVINISLGAAWASTSYTERDKMLMAKIDEAFAEGVVTVAAAGNSSSQASVPYAVFPGDLSNVVSVINIDKNHNKSAGSNYNRDGEYSKNVSAPGAQILSSHGTSEYTYQGVTYKGYANLSGTSTAAPCVSGILALEFAANPSLTAQEAVDTLYGTTRDLGDKGWDKTFGYGEALALEAVQGALGAQLVGPSYMAIGGQAATFSVTGGTDATWSFASSNSKALAINEATGQAQALANGRVTVSATDGNGTTLTKTVVVCSGVVGSDTVGVGKSATYSVEEDLGVFQSWRWSSSNPAVATIGADSGVLTAVSSGTTTVTATLVSDPSLSFTKEVTVGGSQEMYRLYNANSGEHFYTASAQERDDLTVLGWAYEGIGWLAPLSSDTPVYRLYNANAGEHHYTMDAAEKDGLVAAGWVDEGIGWYSDPAKAVPLLREYNPNQFACNHNYTTSQEEHDQLIAWGWQDEGIAWYALAQS